MLAFAVMWAPAANLVQLHGDAYNSTAFSRAEGGWLHMVSQPRMQDINVTCLTACLLLCVQLAFRVRARLLHVRRQQWQQWLHM